MKLARLHSRAASEPYWHVQLALIVAILLQFVLNDNLIVGPKYLIAGVECLLIIALALFGQQQHAVIRRLRRSLAIILIAVISIMNIASLILVVYALFFGNNVTGKSLLLSGLAIYLTNIIIFALWYWELDNYDTTQSGPNPIDFLFPQNTAVDNYPSFEKWQPTFLDYLYVSVTNASAFSPTDTMPLTHRAKSLMGLQGTISLITVALVASRAVNILS